VRGKGVRAIATVSVVIGAFRQEAEYAPDLSALAERMDHALSRDAGRSLDPEIAPEDFTTALLAEVSPEGDVLRLLNRGHPAPYLVHEGQLTRLDAAVPQLPLGMELADAGPPVGPGHPVTEVLPLPLGASLLMVTDGVTEARNHEGTFYDPSLSRLLETRFDNPESLVRTLTADVQRWTQGRQQDDMAILTITRQHTNADP
ncbi:PP2C family protein-serine/threonine phosphatase, partial [Streptomyces aculeolatus]